MVESDKNTASPPADWRQRFLDALRQRNPNAGTCKECGNAGVSTGEHVITQLIWRDGTTRMDEGYLLAMLVCNNCGNAKFYSLKVLGIED